MMETVVNLNPIPIHRTDVSNLTNPSVAFNVLMFNIISTEVVKTQKSAQK